MLKKKMECRDRKKLKTDDKVMVWINRRSLSLPTPHTPTLPVNQWSRPFRLNGVHAYVRMENRYALGIS